MYNILHDVHVYILLKSNYCWNRYYNQNNKIETLLLMILCTKMQNPRDSLCSDVSLFAIVMLPLHENLLNI